MDFLTWNDWIQTISTFYFLIMEKNQFNQQYRLFIANFITYNIYNIVGINATFV